jgi:hypothetical protein
VRSKTRPEDDSGVLVHGGQILLNGGDQGGLGGVGMSVSMCLQVAPHKTVQRIKIGLL